MEKLLREMAKRQLTALKNAGEEPYYDAGAMYVGRGEKRIMVRRGEKYTHKPARYGSKLGEPTQFDTKVL
jgi:hypothetical protein